MGGEQEAKGTILEKAPSEGVLEARESGLSVHQLYTHQRPIYDSTPFPFIVYLCIPSPFFRPLFSSDVSYRGLVFSAVFVFYFFRLCISVLPLYHRDEFRRRCLS
ncbi:unnamed protein product [Pylaiella littoralis]